MTRRELLTGLVAATGAVGLARVADAQITQKRALTLAAARRAIAAAEAEARRLQAPGGVIAVVDDGGNLVALERLDETFAAGANISVGKARTASLFKRPTKAFEDIVNQGRTTMVALPDFTPLQGGVPIVVDGQVIGGIGVSGAASAQQDEELAMAGARAVQSTMVAAPAGAVVHLDQATVTAGFAKGLPLLEVPDFKVHASRRERPGLAEVHEWETDVFYMREGTATMVTGGTVVDPRITEPGQIRGARIDGGIPRRLGPGEVLVIPAGVPHWFREVDAPFTHFVVKPIAANGIRL